MASFKTLKALIILKKINIWYFSSAKELGTVSEKHRNPKPEENNPIFWHFEVVKKSKIFERLDKFKLQVNF